MQYIHGEWKLEILNSNIVVFKSYGSWNEEAAHSYVKEFKLLLAPLIHGPWITLGDVRLWELAVPEMVPIIKDLNKWCVANNCKGKAFFIANELQRKELRRYIAEPDLEPYYYQASQSLDEVLDFIHAQGFSLRKQDVSDWFE